MGASLDTARRRNTRGLLFIRSLRTESGTPFHKNGAADVEMKEEDCSSDVLPKIRSEQMRPRSIALQNREARRRRFDSTRRIERTCRAGRQGSRSTVEAQAHTPYRPFGVVRLRSRRSNPCLRRLKDIGLLPAGEATFNSAGRTPVSRCSGQRLSGAELRGGVQCNPTRLPFTAIRVSRFASWPGTAGFWQVDTEVKPLADSRLKSEGRVSQKLFSLSREAQRFRSFCSEVEPALCSVKYQP